MAKYVTRREFGDFRERLDERALAQQTAMAAALSAAKEAVDKAEKADEKRFDAVNAFRGQLSDQAATFVTRTEVRAWAIAILTAMVSISVAIITIATR